MLHVDFDTAIREFGSLVCGPNTPRNVRQGLLRLINDAGKLCRIEPEIHSAPGTPNTRLRLEASDLLVGLLMAARACDWEKVTILQHDALSPNLVRQSG